MDLFQLYFYLHNAQFLAASFGIVYLNILKKYMTITQRHLYHFFAGLIVCYCYYEKEIVYLLFFFILVYFIISFTSEKYLHKVVLIFTLFFINSLSFYFIFYKNNPHPAIFK